MHTPGRPQILLPAQNNGSSGGGSGPAEGGVPASPRFASPRCAGWRAAGADAGPVLRYKVVVTTSSVPSAGTDGCVWILLEGTIGRSGWMRLEASAGNVSAAGLLAVLVLLPVASRCFFCTGWTACFPGTLKLTRAFSIPTTWQFEPGRRDVFTLAAPDLGHLTGVYVRKEDAGSAPGLSPEPAASGDWHLASVEVFHPGRRRSNACLVHERPQEICLNLCTEGFSSSLAGRMLPHS